MDDLVECPRCRLRFAHPGEATSHVAALEPSIRRCTSCGSPVDRDSLICWLCSQPAQGHADLGTVSVFRRLFPARSSRRPELRMLPLSEILSNPYQPRLDVDVGSESFNRLQESIQSYGVVVPILVTPREKRYLLVAGQRRAAACRRLQMTRIPGIVRRLTDVQVIELSYLENLHRRELTTVEIARTFERLAQESPLVGRQELSRRLGRDPKEVTREAEIVKLPPILQEAMRRGMVTEEQAMILGAVADEPLLVELIRRVYLCRLSVEDTRMLIAGVLSARRGRKTTA